MLFIKKSQVKRAGVQRGVAQCQSASLELRPERKRELGHSGRRQEKGQLALEKHSRSTPLKETGCGYRGWSRWQGRQAG